MFVCNRITCLAERTSVCWKVIKWIRPMHSSTLCLDRSVSLSIHLLSSSSLPHQQPYLCHFVVHNLQRFRVMTRHSTLLVM